MLVLRKPSLNMCSNDLIMSTTYSEHFIDLVYFWRSSSRARHFIASAENGHRVA